MYNPRDIKPILLLIIKLITDILINLIYNYIWKITRDMKTLALLRRAWRHESNATEMERSGVKTNKQQRLRTSGTLVNKSSCSLWWSAQTEHGHRGPGGAAHYAHKGGAHYVRIALHCRFKIPHHCRILNRHNHTGSDEGKLLLTTPQPKISVGGGTLKVSI